MIMVSLMHCQSLIRVEDKARIYWSFLLDNFKSYLFNSPLGSSKLFKYVCPGPALPECVKYISNSLMVITTLICTNPILPDP